MHVAGGSFSDRQRLMRRRRRHRLWRRWVDAGAWVLVMTVVAVLAAGAIVTVK
jgi:hypothetical protein